MNNSCNNLLEQAKHNRAINDKHGPCLSLSTHYSSAKISLFGAHVLSFTTGESQQERLWLSDEAIFDQHTPIRGGVPICWPWFGPRSHSAKNSKNKDDLADSPNHGFARNQTWILDSIQEDIDEQGLCQGIVIELIPTQLGQHSISPLVELRLKLKLNKTLALSLITTNNSSESVYISQALHSYFRLPNVEKAQIKGISSNYFDKPTNTFNNECPQPYFIKGEVDRVHDFSNQKTLVLTDESSPNELIKIEQSGHDSIVVWNPGKALSTSMKDMSDDGYLSMLCLEAANIQPTQILPGKQITLQQVIY